MLLILHISGALVFIGTGAISVINKNALYKKLMRGGVVFEFITGTLLAVNTGTSFGSYCAKMGLYLAFWLVVEAVNFIRISQRAPQKALLEDQAR